ncbi:hypothetical protein MMC30_002606 [Trapelia coarctata]|nr:hypothetical protein [Trapelia coarctata]
MDNLQTRMYYQSMGIGHHDNNIHLEASFQALFTIFQEALRSLEKRHLCYRLSIFFNHPKGIRDLHRALQEAVVYFSNYSGILGTWGIDGSTRVRRRESVNKTLITVFNKVEGDICCHLKKGFRRRGVSYVDLAARVRVYLALMQVDLRAAEEKEEY